MPVVALPCPLCTGTIQVDRDWAGQQVACPLCGGAFVVPLSPIAGEESVANPIVPPPPIFFRPPETTDDAADLLPPGAAARPADLSSISVDAHLPPGAGS